MAVSAPEVSADRILLPDASQPIGKIGDVPVYLDPVWRKSLQLMLDRQRTMAILVNAIRTEVNLHHP